MQYIRLIESGPQYFMCVSFFFRSNSHLSSAIPPLRVGQLNSHHLLSELSTREKNMRKILEGKKKINWDEGKVYFKILNIKLCVLKINYYLFFPTTSCRSQNRSMRRPFLRLSSPTAARQAPTWGRVQDCRRGNMAWLSWRVTQQTPPPRILHRCSTAAVKNPS